MLRQRLVAGAQLVPGTEALEMLTGKWPEIGISPNRALAALISETVALENVQM